MARAKILGLGHVGIYCRDLEKMVAFYRDVMGMTLTKQDWQWGMVFFSSEPQQTDHEIALMRGRPETPEDPHLIQQISLRVGSLDDVREFHRRIVDAGCQIDHVVTHASAIGCYFFDPEGNRTEVFWLTGRPCWVPTGVPIDIFRPDEEVMADVDRVWEPLRHVPVGGLLERAAAPA
jgi:catechol 2,3-dioxygenase-like lactoylglutathione lyase family enzyme